MKKIFNTQFMAWVRIFDPGTRLPRLVDVPMSPVPLLALNASMLIVWHWSFK
jgi:hypothetical protein